MQQLAAGSCRVSVSEKNLSVPVNDDVEVGRVGSIASASRMASVRDVGQLCLVLANPLRRGCVVVVVCRLV